MCIFLFSNFLVVLLMRARVGDTLIDKNAYSLIFSIGCWLFWCTQIEFCLILFSELNIRISVLLIFAQLSFFNSLSTFVYLHFYIYHHQSICKHNFTDIFLMITFVNLENRLFAIACPFGGENRRILSVYKCLIINKMRFNIHLLFSLLRSFYHFLLWFLCQKFIFWCFYFGRMTFKKMTRGVGLMFYEFCLIIILCLLTLR